MTKVFFVVMALLIVMASSYAGEQTLTGYESQIQAFEKADRLNPPPEGAIVFAGSSTFTLWKTMSDDFSPLPVINRGFGGSTFPELIHYAERIILPYRPKIIIIYEGDNDLTDTTTHAAQLLENFTLLSSKLRLALPHTTIYYLSIKPSIARWARWDEAKKANQMIAAYVKGRKGLGFIDISPAIIGADGKPGPELFGDDSLHLNREGYARITAIIRPILEKEYKGSL